MIDPKDPPLPEPLEPGEADEVPDWFKEMVEKAAESAAAEEAKEGGGNGHPKDDDE